MSRDLHLFVHLLQPHLFCQVNTFQVVFVSDGINSMVLLHYGRIDWTTGTTGQGDPVTGLGGTAANVGR